MTIFGVDLWQLAVTLVVWTFFGIPIKNFLLWAWRSTPFGKPKAA